MNTIDDILQSLPSREDIASAMGLHTRTSLGNTDILPALGLFGTGMLFGAGLALLFAPKTGAQIRRSLSEKAQEYGTQAREMMDDASSSTSRQVGQGSQTQGAGETGHEYRSPYTGSRNI